ncbi:MAG: transglycosylase SLT domain-containing protein, partial [Acidobacteriota bacterium]|nr:transglycosylase SLT domain-containing protein [Acidobacteriota bacterium]
MRTPLVFLVVFATLTLQSALGASQVTIQSSPIPPSSLDTSTNDVLPLEQFSPSFLGMYRKVMEIEDEIRRHTDRYDLHYDLARAVCLYESGGNAGLSSGPGARGYFQVMPATFRSLRVDTNI